MYRNTKKGIYKLPKHAERKYIGNKDNIVYRSSWEKKVLDWCCNSSKVKRFSSEELVIPYISKLDGKEHRYFCDFYIELEKNDGTLQRLAVEVKPYAKYINAIEGVKEGSNKRRFINESIEAQRNRDKWNQITKICKKHGIQFIILHERNSGGIFLS